MLFRVIWPLVALVYVVDIFFGASWEPGRELLFFTHYNILWPHFISFVMFVRNRGIDARQELLTVHHKHSKWHRLTQGTLGYHFIFTTIIRSAPEDTQFYVKVKGNWRAVKMKWKCISVANLCTYCKFFPFKFFSSSFEFLKFMVVLQTTHMGILRFHYYWFEITYLLISKELTPYFCWRP